MRWPVRHQVLWPMAAVMLCTLLGVTCVNTYFAAKQARGQVERQLHDVVATLREARFPLSNVVLRQMRGLSGADFVVLDRQGRVLASSMDAPLAEDGLTVLARRESRATRSLLGQAILLDNRDYFHAAVSQPPADDHQQTRRTLHVLYPVTDYDLLWRQAVIPPVAVGAFAMSLVATVGVAVSRRVTQPLSRLQVQVDQIARGDFQQLPIAARDDEIADLSRAINHMSAMLVNYEQDVRKHERLRTLAQLAGGMAHQLRNAATGGRLAVELHQRVCPLSNHESLLVAQKQFEVMERHLRQLLSLGHYDPRAHQPVDLADVIAGSARLVRPVAEHMMVELSTNFVTGSTEVMGDREGLEQLFVNVISNAIEAAAEREPGKRRVKISLNDLGENIVAHVSDSGLGPPTKIQDKLFDPFVTGKLEGTGLGLAVAQEIAAVHGGSIRWTRSCEETMFLVELPRRLTGELASNKQQPKDTVLPGNAQR